MKMHVRIRKVAEAPNARCKAAPWADHVPGAVNHHGKSLPLGYELEGELTQPLVVGGPLVVRRTHRNGVEFRGVFTTSPIAAIETNQVWTQNSVYLVTFLDADRKSGEAAAS